MKLFLMQLGPIFDPIILFNQMIDIYITILIYKYEFSILNIDKVINQN